MSDEYKEMRIDGIDDSMEVVEERFGEFSMRVPAEPDRDADFVLKGAADLIESLRQQLADSQKREVMLRDALLTCSVGDFSTGHVIYPSFDEKLVEEALAATEPKP